MSTKVTAPSVAVYCPQSKAPQKEFLDEIRAYILSNPHLQRLAEDAKRLIETWNLVAAKREDIAELSQGPRYMQAISDWLTHGRSGPVANIMSGILSLPLLVIVQMVQHFQFLEVSGMTHPEFLEGLKNGKGAGAQGYCAGLLPAFAIACAWDEESLITSASTAMRVALTIGAYGELGDDKVLDGPTTIVLRLKYEGQGDEIVKGFPGAYVSAVTDPKTISIVGPVLTLEAVSEYARSQGLLVQSMHLRGKVHNPENMDLAAELCALCDQHENLQLPSWDKMQIQVNSNKTGKPLKEFNPTHEAVYTILATRCEWYTLLQEVAEQLKPAKTGTDKHTIVLFGIGDPVPLSPFHQARLNITKVEAHRVVKESKLSAYTPSDDSIAIVGASCRLPGANNLEELWDLMSNATSTHEPIRPDRVPIRASFRAAQDQSFARKDFFGNFVDDVEAFDHQFFKMSPKEVISMDPQQRVLLELAYEAMDASGYLRHHERQRFDNVGCFIGASFTEYLENTTAHPPSAYAATGTIRAFLCGKISYYFGWSGPSEVIDTACSSSLVAVHRACRAISAGECPMAVAGGVNIITGVQNYIDLGKAGFLSPTGQCKPFDGKADGYCRSDGAGLVVLKKLSDAMADGDEILGVITGVATNQGGLSSSITVPHSESQIELYKRVLAQSKMQADHVTYVEAHGTGTQAGDPLEIASLREVFGGSDRISNLHVGSLKGNIGHCETAAGVAGLLKVLAMLKQGKIPPLASHKSLNPKIPALAPSKMVLDKRVEAWDAPIRVACVNSYGAAGSNAALLCCEGPKSYTPSKAITSHPILALSTVPILLSASSKDSLVAYAKRLATHLTATPSITLPSLAFTLSQRRKHHRYIFSASVSSLPDLLSTLSSLTPTSPAIHDTTPQPTQKKKPIVLAFAGQAKQIVGLSQSLYDATPALQKHILACDAALTKLGFPSILPGIFSKAPLSDVVVLQTGTFAVQYAVAQCWIEGGLAVEAVIGHSFGELTALVVSGILSLEDGVKIIGTRARLMATKWGVERGSMLAVHSSRDVVRDVVGVVGEGEIEIACFNADTSQVLVGSDGAVARAEELLKRESRFSGIRYQRLDVSHGFHSRFTEPLLEDLERVAGGVTFRKAEIHLETCTTELKKGVLAADHIVQHTRKPVYFVDAVQRLEQRLGACVWLEAGTDSVIIPMVKRASRESGHVFQGLKFGEGHDSEAILGSVTMDLWKEGVQAAYWPFLSPQESGLKPVWLPPYVFNKTKAYLENIDRAIEAQKLAASMPALPAGAAAAAVVAPSLLVTPLEKKADSADFTVHIDTKRFTKIVSGHAVRARPLCPASMYMECAVMSAQCHHGDSDFSKHALHFENLSFESPLGTDTSRQVQLKLKNTANPTAWDFLLTSSPKAKQGSGKLTTHGKGSLSLTSQPRLATYQRLVSSRLGEIASQPDAETLMSKRAYGLFSQVVTYADLLKGMHSITMYGNEAVATIRVPDGHAGESESTAIDCCDTVALDTFIQVVGLLINSSEHCSPGCCFVASGVDTATLGVGCSFQKPASWGVYATYTMLGETKAVGDVFVMTPDNTVVGAILGVAFTRLPIDALERMLDSANPSSAPKNAAKKAQPTAVAQVVQDSRVSTPPSRQAGDSGYASDSGLAASPKETGQLKLAQLIASYTGADPEAIDVNAQIGDLGVDSLAAVELAADITAQFGKEIAATDILETTTAALLKELGASVVPTISAAAAVRAVESIQSTPAVATPSSSGTATPPTQETSGQRKALYAILEDISGADMTTVSEDQTLRDLGVDSLAVVQLQGDLEAAFSIELESEDIDLDLTIKQILKLAGISGSDSAPVAAPAAAAASEPAPQVNAYTPAPPTVVKPTPAPEPATPAYLGHLADQLSAAETTLPQAAERCGFKSYWTVVARRQDEIVVAYILEAFKSLGVDLWAMRASSPLPHIQYLAKHEKVMKRFWQILQKHGIIERGPHSPSSWVRTPVSWPRTSSSELTEKFIAEFPRYASEARLMALTGPKLAECLTGKADPIALLFTNKTSQAALQDFYTNSPMLATATEFLSEVVRRSIAASRGPTVRIVEIGAGFGGTTNRLLETITGLNRKIEYTFTDVATALVSRASKVFGSQHSASTTGVTMDFKTIDIENDPPAAMKGRYDLAISTNCVHATHDRTTTMRNIKSLLNEEGQMVLSEVTEIVDWYDVVYGLIDGWWYAPDGAYPLQPPQNWMQCFRKVGLNGTYSNGPTRDLTSQRLLIGAHRPPSSSTVLPRGEIAPKSKVETVVYKVADGVEVEADIYLPLTPPEEAMDIALLIHGGGHMTLSRKAIRPAQTAHLLSQNILPVSIDYRLCPEVTLIEGPIADVRDAYVWAQKQLPGMVKPMGITVKADNIAVVGWSTGGHLGMTLGWTHKEAGVSPPKAVLSFYGPTDFESGDLDVRRAEEYPERQMSMANIIASLPKQPITNYATTTIDATNMGWVRPGDPRSELVLSLFKEGNGLPLLLNGLSSPDSLQTPPDPNKVAYISPLSHVRDGSYTIPTYLVHGTQDEIVPYQTAVKFVAECREKGVECGFLTVPGARHIHDLEARTGMVGWEEGVAGGYEFLVGKLNA
uniref:MollE n=1 Tax=Ovatospora sp. TaxID=2911399 RepID=A0AA96XP89_9PEZI|nr:MollE [Ovatospora sp.]